MISVLLAEPHPIYREGLAARIDSDARMEVIGLATTGPETLEACVEKRPDVLLLDLFLPSQDGLSVLEKIWCSGSRTRPIVLSAEADPQVAHRALEVGAAGYLLKDSSGKEICDQIAAIAGGAVAVSPALQEGILREIRVKASSVLLSEREQEVLQLVADGRTNREIAAALGVGPATVKTYVARLCQKLGAVDRTSAATIGLQRGLITARAHLRSVSI